jgi:hypothetical protein
MRMINQIPEPYKDELKDQVGYGSISDSECYSILILFFFAYSFGGWIILSIKNWKSSS